MRWIVLLAVFILAGCNAASGALPATTVRATSVPTLIPAATSEPTELVTVADTQEPPISTVTDTPEPTATIPDTPIPVPSATITDTPTSQPTSTLQATSTETVRADVQAMTSETYYTSGQINLRTCPSTSCDIAGQLAAGAGITVDGQTNGDAVNSGNSVWYRVQYAGGVAYVYSALVAQRSAPPVQQQQVQQPPPAQPTQAPQQQIPRPGNCSTAVAMGLSAQQAAQWSHLDRDNDGVACYGD